MEFTNIRLPKQLEDADVSEAILAAIRKSPARLWPQGRIEMLSLALDNALEQELRRSVLTGRILFGYEEIVKQLANEARGIRAAAQRSDSAPGERVSRLLLIANDGSERFYRRLEHLIELHSPRVMGCLVSCSADQLGRAATGRTRRVKVVMAEHKDAVSAILRLLL